MTVSLHTGEVPNIFPSDERVAICEKVRPFAKEQFGRAAGDMSPLQLYAYFIQRVKQYLHIILAFSPIGSAFRDRLRLFPSLVNCCAIDWFTAWPGDALLAVAEKFLKEVSLSDEVRPAIVSDSASELQSCEDGVDVAVRVSTRNAVGRRRSTCA